jgi:succinyl-CoA synthetase beta subunit
VDLVEYQGKQLLSRHGVAVPAGGVADTVDEAVAAAEAVGFPVVVKAQVRVGGRGKAGGIRVAPTADDVRTNAAAMLGMPVHGHVVRRLWIEEASEVAHEHYASFTLDRAAKLHLALVSARGGVDIEEVAAEEPDAVTRLHIDPLDGLTEDTVGDLLRRAQVGTGVEDQMTAMVLRLWDAYREGDAELLEVNPLVVTASGAVVALDAKVTLDDSATFRHPEWQEWRVDEEVDQRERFARDRGLNYVGLAGSVGIIGNGAGLVMSTLDVVNQAGGTAANFLDVGGGAGADVIANALEVVNSDDSVRAILVNIFGGITRGDQVAQGIVDALGRVDLRSPIVVRLDGTNAEEGRAILAVHQSDRLIPVATMLDAARTAVDLASGEPRL